MRVAGHRADVDVEVDDVGDGVGLLAAVHHVGRDRRVHARVGSAGQPRVERGDRLVDPGRVAQRRPQVVGQVEAGELGRPQVVEAGHTPVLRQAAHHLGRGHERVVRPVRHRPVAGRSADPQAQPGEALLGDADGDPPHAVGTGRRPPAGLGEHVVGTDGVPVLVDHVLGAPPPAGLLVGDAEVDQRAPRAEPLVASRRKATAIDDVMLSMSIAPRPHTSARPSAARPARRRTGRVTTRRR